MNQGLQAWNEETEQQMYVLLMKWDLWAYRQGVNAQRDWFLRNGLLH